MIESHQRSARTSAEDDNSAGQLKLQGELRFPQTISRVDPKVVEINFALIPSIIVTVSGNVPERTLNKYANNLQDEIEELDSVLSADLAGARDEMVEVIIDTSKLESYNLTALELINAINQNNKVV